MCKKIDSVSLPVAEIPTQEGKLFLYLILSVFSKVIVAGRIPANSRQAVKMGL
jgi:hypothetical protein